MSVRRFARRMQDPRRPFAPSCNSYNRTAETVSLPGTTHPAMRSFLVSMLDQSFLGNTILDWAIAVGAALLTGVVLIAVRMQGLRWLAVRNSKPHSRPIGWSFSVFEGTKPWFLIAVAMFVGLQFVAIPPKVDRFLEHVTIIAVIAQAAFWASLRSEEH